MDHYTYQLTRCWTYAYGQFVDQAHRFALRTASAPRAARDIVARLHGFADWSGLAQMLQDLHDIGCALALEVDHGPAEESFRRGVFVQVERLAAMDHPARVEHLRRALRPKYAASAEIPGVDDEGFSDSEFAAAVQYERIKLEMAYRTLWTREGNNSAYVQNIGIEMAERLAMWYPGLAPDIDTALRIVFDFYGCSYESRTLCSPGPLADYLGQKHTGRRRVSEILDLSWNMPRPWRRATALWRDLAYAAPVELDIECECYPVLALLPHAPRDVYVQIDVDKGGTAALDCRTLLPDSTGLAQLAFLGSGAALEVAVIDVPTAHDVLRDPDKAGWLKVTWNMSGELPDLGAGVGDR
jgi:hypothetical protein